MVKQLFNKIFGMTYMDQKRTLTWTGIASQYVSDFIASGCALCSLNMLTGCMECDPDLMPSQLVARGVCSTSFPSITDWDLASDEFDMEHDYSSPLSSAAFQLIQEENPVVIEVTGHFVVARGFYGFLTVVNGNPDYTEATAAMIKVYDPYDGDNETLQDVLDSRSASLISLRKIS